MNKEKPTYLNYAAISELRDQLEAERYKNKKLKKKLKITKDALEMVCIHCDTERFECDCGCVFPCKDCNSHYTARDALRDIRKIK